MPQARSINFMVLIAVVAISIIALLGFGYRREGSWNLPSVPGASKVENSPPPPSPSPAPIHHDLVDIFFKEIQKPSIEPDAPVYKPFGAFDWKLEGDAFWKKPMGKDLCIIDIDNRPFEKPGQAFGPSMSWDNASTIHGLSLGIMNHWIYSKIHGYQYYFVTFDDPKDRRASWEKPSIIAKILEKHKTCVYLDSDAIFYNLDLPMEWLMNYWQIDPDNHSMSLSFDPNFPHNLDIFKKLYLNTGFIINQNNSKTFEILKDWDDCTNENGKHPGCSDFRFHQNGRPTDQGGFGSYIRYDYMDNIKGLPCAEANGFPEDPSECKGVFIRHMWSGKATLIKTVTGHQFPGKFLEVLHERFVSEKDQFFKTKKALMQS